MPGRGTAAGAGEPDPLRLGHQIADRQDQALGPDHHAVALPLGAQDRGGVGVLRHLRPHGEDRGERGLEREAELGGVGARHGRDVVLVLIHGSGSFAGG